MRLHREGTSTLLAASAVCCFTLYFLWYRTSWPLAVQASATVVVAALFAVVVLFFRVPVRTPVHDANTVLAPADGRVVVIEEVDDPEFPAHRAIQVSIFMSPFNVHVNWFPVEGAVSYTRYHPGKYLVAWHPKSSTENERSTLVVDHPRHGAVLVRQIAGALARRIRTYAKPGDKAEQGHEFGFIKFGSRVDVLLPRHARITVSLGNKVRGSITPIAQFNG
jgi:phosphatidylserine decarboxylase